MDLSPGQRSELEALLAKATAQRAELDATLFAIEAIVGYVDDGLDEAVGNGIDVDGLLEMVAEGVEN